jgi:hypothetical protein
MMGIAYARLVMSTEPIRPLYDVWLRPRRVFRELAERPVGRVDQLLGAAQGVVGLLEYFRTKDVGATDSLAQIFGAAFLVGSVVGIASLYIMAAIYARVAGLSGNPTMRRQVVHVLAYGGVPMAVSLGIWIITALLAGETTFTQPLRPDVENFIALLLRAQFVSYVFLMIWSVILQVMGFSEILGVANRKAFGIWVLGQLVGVLAALFVSVLIVTLFPGVA